MVTAFQLEIMSGPQAGATYRFPVPSSCIVGRASDCDVAVIGVPDALSVSRKHCRFEITPTGVRLQDLGSRNGTFVNGELIGKRFCADRPNHDWWMSEGRLINHGDEIEFAGIVLRVQVETAEYEWMPTEMAAVDPAGAKFPCREMSW